MKRAVITGSTKGIGKSIGLDLLKQGYYVYFNYANDDKGGEDLRHEIISYTNFEIIKNGFENEEKIKCFCDEIRSKGPIDVLVCNAGITDRTPWGSVSMDNWNKVIYLNVTVPAMLIQNFGYDMKEGGSIICIGSIMGKYPHSMSVSYGVSKKALHFLVESLVKEYCDRQITINAICTGFTDTEWQKKKPMEQRDRILKRLHWGDLQTL